MKFQVKTKIKNKFALAKELFYKRKYGEAQKIFEQLMDGGFDEAKKWLVDCIIEEYSIPGRRKDADVYESIKQYADEGGVNACLFVFMEELKKNNEREAINYLMKAAELKNVEAMYVLASAYMDPSIDNYGPLSCIEKNEEKAVELWTYCAEQGDCLAMGELGYLYRKGIGVERDEEKGLQLMEEAYTKSKGTNAHYRISEWLRGDWIKKRENSKAFIEGLRGAFIGDRRIWMEMVGGFVSGLLGVQLPYFEKDYKNALNCYVHADEFVEKQYLMNLIDEIEKNDISDPDMMYLLGRGYEMLGDNSKSATCYIRACEMGNRGNRLAARLLLYRLYENGVKLNEDYILELVEKSIDFTDEEIASIDNESIRKEEKVNAYKYLQQTGAFALVSTYYWKFKDKKKLSDNKKRYAILCKAARCKDINCIEYLISALVNGEFDDIDEIFDKRRTIMYWMNKALKNELFPYENASYLIWLDKKRYVKNHRESVMFDDYVGKLRKDGITFVHREGTVLFDYVFVKPKEESESN